MLTMLLSFSPLSSDVIVQLSEGLQDVTVVSVVRLHEMYSEADMSRRFHTVLFSLSSPLTSLWSRSLTEFFSSSSPTPAMVVIQCEPSITSTQRVHHTKYLCENIRGKLYRAGLPRIIVAPPSLTVTIIGMPLRHVVMLVHVNRAAETPFTFDFDKTWGYAFVSVLLFPPPSI